MLNTIRWETVGVLALVFTVILITWLGGRSAGFSSEEVQAMLGPEALLGALLAGVMRQLFRREDSEGEG